jgi:NADPH:quinone reductase-like Zn-dependent oxidoreductase
VDPSWQGKKVAFVGSGWSNFVCKPVDFVVEFQSDFDLKKGANTYVNPFTVTAMLDYAQKMGAKSVVLMAASSALSKMMIRLANQNGMETINIVRKDDQVADLKSNYGAKYAFNSDSASFWTDIESTFK